MLPLFPSSSGVPAVSDEDGIPRHGIFRHRPTSIKPPAISSTLMFVFFNLCICQKFLSISFHPFYRSDLRMSQFSRLFNSDDLLITIPVLEALTRQYVEGTIRLADCLVMKQLTANSSLAIRNELRSEKGKESESGSLARCEEHYEKRKIRANIARDPLLSKF